ncbi:MAG: hypothetical protein NC342_02225 [Pseudoflavonifractor sp.]|nr:hypothetical protein [Alloprevotella sp.]MCM1116338.1 hypothetical protein [Pseudoflavonifractor sp.]
MDYDRNDVSDWSPEPIVGDDGTSRVRFCNNATSRSFMVTAAGVSRDGHIVSL